ncbi:hypothetical protein PROFUN_09561 [Planoprotostelium fungivorum]|uniref:Ribosomal protein mS38 C-terminal domain-containing protein n=1 Tax=Planoprotostelium fungivorum TaxID=1890364 RepID=A0A2P6MT25_9EUKA|nr:hypothetical protein PROFUN_09561 [Planoprotostelium fungivorum]
MFASKMWSASVGGMSRTAPMARLAPTGCRSFSQIEMVTPAPQGIRLPFLNPMIVPNRCPSVITPSRLPNVIEQEKKTVIGDDGQNGVNMELTSKVRKRALKMKKHKWKKLKKRDRQERIRLGKI